MSLTEAKNKKIAIKKLMNGLLAGTCLTAGSAYATTVSEPPDFANTLAAAVALPLAIGTDVVNGSVSFSDPDFVDFQGLLGGGSYTVLFTALSGPLNFSIFTSSGTQIGSTAISATSTSFAGTIPGDGQLVARVTQDEGSNYRITLTAPQSTETPEPASAALVGLGVAAVGAIAARRRKQSK